MEIKRKISYATCRESNPGSSPTDHRDKDEARSSLEPPVLVTEVPSS